MKIRYKNYSYELYILIKEVKGKGNSFKKEFYLLKQDFVLKSKVFQKQKR